MGAIRRYEFRQGLPEGWSQLPRSRRGGELHSFPARQRSRRSEQASIFEACAETKGKLQLPVFLKLLHGDRDLDVAERRTRVEQLPCSLGRPAAGALGGSPRPRGASLRCPGRRGVAAGCRCPRSWLWLCSSSLSIVPGDPGDPRSVAGTSSEAPRGGLRRPAET